MTPGRDVYCFVRITPANYLYALWLSLRAPVAAWKIELPGSLARRFERIRPYRIFSRDEWLLAHDRAFDLWKAHALPHLVARHRVNAQIDRTAVDFSRNLWQLHGIEFEALSLFVSMLSKRPQGSTRVVAPWIARAFARGELERIFPGVRFVASALNHRLEALREWGISAAHLGRTLAYFGRSLFRGQRRVGSRQVVWLGISATELPETHNRLNFAWAAQYGYLDAADVLYSLPCTPTRTQRAYVEANGITAVEPEAEFELIPWRARWVVAARSTAGFVSGLIKPGAIGPLSARFLARAPYWARLFREVGATTYVTTTSYAWPEKPELAVAHARGLRSVIWAYSANSPTFAVQDTSFRDLGIARSVVVASEFWAWNDAYIEWMRARQIAEPHCTFQRVGPLMCGNPAHLELDRAVARRRLRLPKTGLCIGVFDMPPMNDTWRDRFGGGPPMISLESYVAFWDAIARLLERVPEAFALVKLKRDFEHPYRALPEVLKTMLAESSPFMRDGRIRLIETEIDPYLPVAASDVAIAVPYTSPVLAARTIGRPAFYLDPLGLANVPSCAEYKTLTVVSETEALEIVRAAQQGTNTFDQAGLPELTPPRPVFPLAGSSEGGAMRRAPAIVAAT